MTETSDHVSTRRRGRLPWTVVGAIALVMGIAGCGGYASTAAMPAPSGSTPQNQASPPTQSSPSSGSASASGIPQGNRGDMDADNNGGPNDGDGNQ